MNFFLTAIAFIVIFSLLVLIHEWGHFFAARKNGIKVEEFGFGLPPRIWGVKKGETLYSLNAIPFGGFVRLLGEDSRDPKLIKNPRSFSAKSLWARSTVVLAGVVMNFLLAFVLLTLGFIVGIQPLILSGDDVFNRIADGTIQTQAGVLIKEVKEGGLAQMAGLEVNDILLNVNGKPVVSAEYLDGLVKQSDTPLDLEVLRGEEKKLFHLEVQNPSEGFGFSPYELLFLPRLQVHDLPLDSAYALAGLRIGDVLLKVNENDIYTLNDFQQSLDNSTNFHFLLLRDGMIQNIDLKPPVEERVVVNTVFPGTPAENAGFRFGDVIVAVDSQPILLPGQLIELTKRSPGQLLNYSVRRNGVLQNIPVIPDENGLIGVGLTMLSPYQNSQLGFFNRDIPMSVLKIQNVRYPFWIAPVRALEESGRLSVLTVEMFGNVIHSLVTRFAVPEGVSGPVGIAQMTSVFVQEGIWSLLRFMALLSLSLAIINVLPFPALDGGRFLFIVIELLSGKRLNGKYEALIHGIGFLLLMGLIAAVTFSDIMKLFS